MSNIMMSILFSITNGNLIQTNKIIFFVKSPYVSLLKIKKKMLSRFTSSSIGLPIWLYVPNFKTECNRLDCGSLTHTNIAFYEYRV